MTNQNQNQFSSGLESGNFLVTSDPVHQAWSAIEQQRQIVPNAEHSLYNEIQLENQTIIAFGTPPGSLQGQEGLVSSKDFAHFEFLCNKKTTDFCINEAAIRQFQSHYDELLLLKNKLVDNSKSRSAPLIFITGQSVGGVVATLFTLWLLEGLNLNTTGGYKPFGTFLLCSASGCACSDFPDFISEEFLKTNSQSVQTPDPNLRFSYGQILEDLKRKALCNVFMSIGRESNPLQASIVTQLLATAVVSQQQSRMDLVEKMKRHETKLLIQKKNNSDSDTKLNEMKINMAYLEWYKKESKRQDIGYYDMYRNQHKQPDIRDIKVNEYKKKLMNYWEDSVKEVENKPQLEGAHFRVRWLYAGTTYRRMVEPLHIADHYNDGGENHQTYDGKRPKHFSLLEEWLQTQQEQDEKKKKEQEKKKQQETQIQEEKPESDPLKSKREKVGTSLNDDSCFWARVEEALILLENEGLTTDDERRLKEFEDYVWNALKTYAVSPEIFLKSSSFMKWWNGYKGVFENFNSPLLLDFMTNGGPSEYEAGNFT